MGLKIVPVVPFDRFHAHELGGLRGIDTSVAPCYNNHWPGSAGAVVPKAFVLTFPAIFCA
jgi:hypothetical protein